MSDPAIQACDDHIASAGIDTSSPKWRTGLKQPPAFPFDGDKTYYWVMETSVGTIRIKLLPKVAPNHVSSTMFLSRLGRAMTRTSGGFHDRPVDNMMRGTTAQTIAAKTSPMIRPRKNGRAARYRRAPP